MAPRNGSGQNLGHEHRDEPSLHANVHVDKHASSQELAVGFGSVTDGDAGDADAVHEDKDLF